MLPAPWHVHLDPHAGGYALGFSAHKVHQEGATCCMLGEGSKEQQHEAAHDVRGTWHGGWYKSGTLGHWRVKTGLSDEGMGGDGSNHWHYASGRSLCHSVPKLE